MMSTSMQICVYIMAASLCLSHFTHAGYVDCSMECLFAAFRKPSLCQCKNTLKLHWGKRAPRLRSHTLPTFRYGKRATPFLNQGYNSELGERLDTLRSIQEALQGDSMEYDV